MIDLGAIARGVAATKAVGMPIIESLEASSALTTKAFNLLAPHAFSEVGAAERTLIPLATISKVDDLLAEAFMHSGKARVGLHDAFGAGTWMADFVNEDQAFISAARRTLADPVLGPDSADTARRLLNRNNFARTQTIESLQTGHMEKLADPDMAGYIQRFDDAALADANDWRTHFARAMAQA